MPALSTERLQGVGLLAIIAQCHNVAESVFSRSPVSGSRAGLFCFLSELLNGHAQCPYPLGIFAQAFCERHHLRPRKAAAVPVLPIAHIYPLTVQAEVQVLESVARHL
jgi:hypothetical protein